MVCQHCQALNDADDHRCGRCGRRLRVSAARPAPEAYISTAAAPSLAGLYDALSRDAVTTTSVAPALSEAEPVLARATYQRALFGEMTRVVAMPGSSRQESTRTEAEQPERTARPRSRRRNNDQQDLGFAAASDRIETTSEAIIYCESPVALPSHRAMAVMLDLSMVLVGLALFLITFKLAGGQIDVNKHTLPLLASITAVFSVFYHFLFCICGGDTPGMRWTQLRLVDFDGRKPDREQRLYRLAGAYLSMLSAGLGLVWALVDEESLTWHDHISKTFPSPHQPE